MNVQFRIVGLREMRISTVLCLNIILFCAVAAAAAAAASDGLTLEGPPKPAFLYAGAKDDFGWQQSIDRSRVITESAMKTEIPYAENVPAAADVATATEKFINQGYNIIIGDSPGYSSTFSDLAAKFPKTAFINITSNSLGAPKLSNLRSVYGRIYESQYLCGVIAGEVSKTGNIGFLARQPASVENWEINAYALGVQAVKPDASVHVIFTDASDPAKERAAASTLIDRGADVLGQSIDGPTPQIVAQERGVFATGHAVDLHEMAPENIVCSSVWVWDRYLSAEINKIASGLWNADPNYQLVGMTGGATDIACCSKAISAEAMNKLIAKRDGIIISRNHVFSGPLMDRDGKERVAVGSTISDSDLWAMDWYVKGVMIEN
jgi:basic membrane protein A and related proteins